MNTESYDQPIHTYIHTRIVTSSLHHRDNTEQKFPQAMNVPSISSIRTLITLCLRFLSHKPHHPDSLYPWYQRTYLIFHCLLHRYRTRLQTISLTTSFLHFRSSCHRSLITFIIYICCTSHMEYIHKCKRSILWYY